MTSRIYPAFTRLTGWTVLIMMCCAVECLAGDRPSFFVVVPQATDIRQSKFQGHDQLIYEVEAEYPASDVLRIINTRLKVGGWKPLKKDWLNPDIPSSQERGWSFFEDHSTHPETSVSAWQADWTNDKGDMLIYILEYRCPGKLCLSTANLHKLRVMEIHLPASLAEQIKRSIPKQ